MSKTIFYAKLFKKFSFLKIKIHVFRKADFFEKKLLPNLLISEDLFLSFLKTSGNKVIKFFIKKVRKGGGICVFLIFIFYRDKTRLKKS